MRGKKLVAIHLGMERKGSVFI